MAEFTKIEIWRSPGFSEEGVELPLAGATISSPNLTYEDSIRPSADRMFSELKIPDTYGALAAATYMRLTYKSNNDSGYRTFYGWVDSVEISSDTLGYPMCTIKWHVDLWRTYISSATFGFGHVTRKPSGDAPLQGYGYVYREVASTADLLDYLTFSGQRVWWAVIACTVTVNTYKVMEYRTFPVAVGQTIYVNAAGTTVKAPTSNELLSGYWDELFGLDPDAVTGAWISPIPPIAVSSITGSGTSSSPYRMPFSATSGGWMGQSYGSDPHGWFYKMRLVGTPATDFPETAKSISRISTEMDQLVVTGCDGEIVQEIPIGRTLSSYTYRLALSPLECDVVVRFHGTASRPEGLCATIPCPSLDLTENAWSSYTFSGQREYEKEMRQIQSVQSGIESLASGGSSGALMGGFSKAGGAVGALAGSVSGALSMGLDSAVFNPQIQIREDRYRQKQSAGILLSGNAADILAHGEFPKLKTLAFDDYSFNAANWESSRYGYACDEWRTSCSGISTEAGFWRVDSLTVGGIIPAEAKKYIARRLAGGVYLK